MKQTAKNIFRILTTPSCWIRNYGYNPTVDKIITTFLDENREITLGSHHAYVGNASIWIRNYPYAYGEVIGLTGLPSRTTVFRLHDTLQKKIVKEMTK